jgi:hypothetical protein
MRRMSAGRAMLLLVAVIACNDSSTGPDDGRLLRRYYAIGGVTAAGYRSGGLTAASQMEAYPALLAARASVDFDIALVANPGCPAPFTAPVTPPAGAQNCALQDNGDAPGQLLAVPGERAADALVDAPDPPPDLGTAFKRLLLDDRTAMEVAEDRDATFVTIHVGEADVNAAATSGTLGVLPGETSPNLTSTASFTQSVTAIAAEVATIGSLEGAAVVGILDPVVSSPLLQRGAFFFLARDAAGRFMGKPVNNNCSPVTALGQPNPLSTNLVSFGTVLSATPAEINCDPAQFNGEFLLDANEQTTIRTRVTEFNQALSQVAAQNGWAFVDPNTVVAPLLTQTDGNGRYQQIRKCQLLPTATTAAQFQAAVLNSCPVTGPTAAPNMFGAMVSLDAIHPSAAFQQLLADEIAARVNSLYGPASIP